jgi:hypothetical protein
VIAIFWLRCVVVYLRGEPTWFFLKLPTEVATNFREARANAYMHEPAHAMD